MSDILFKAVQGQVNIDEAKGIVECFVAGVGNKDSVGDVVLPGAFSGSLKRRKPRVVWGHDWNQPIGKVLDIFEVSSSDPRLPMKMKQAGIGGLFARVQFNLKSERGREAFASVAFFGEDQEWSIGYKTLDAIYDNERKANLLREVELYEVSPVLHGANQLTGTISVKSENQDRVTSFQKSKWKTFDREFARRIREDYPEIWKKGGNIKGNDQYEILSKIAKQGGAAKTEDQINALELREAWVARHAGDFLLAGVVAQMKWLAVGSRGEDHMKKVVNEAIKKMKMNEKSLDWDEDEDMDLNESEKGYGKPNKDKLQALMDAVLKAADEMDDEVELDEDDFDDTEMKDKFWKLRRLLGMSPGSSVEAPVMARPVWEDDDDDDMMPMRKPGGCGCGCGGKSSCVVEDAEYALKFLDDSEIEEKAGRVLSTNNMQKLQNAIELLKEVMASGGRQDIEMKEKDALFIDADMGELFGLKELIDPILEYHFVDAEVLENGIFVKSDDYEVEDAINTALSHYFSGGIEYKGLGGRIGRSVRRMSRGGGGGRGGRGGGRGRRGLNANANFDPNARDADGDGTLQEGTRFARPASSNKPDVQKLRVSGNSREIDRINTGLDRLNAREPEKPIKPKKPISDVADQIFGNYYSNNTPEEAIQAAIEDFQETRDAGRKYTVGDEEIDAMEFGRLVREIQDAYGIGGSSKPKTNAQKPKKPNADARDDKVTKAEKKLSDDLVKLLGKNGEMRIVNSEKPYDEVNKIKDPKKRAEVKKALDDFYNVYNPARKPK